MKLFLTSTGLPLETRDFFLNILDKSPQDSQVAFIPTAADPYKDKWFVDASRKELIELGLPVIDVDLKDDPEKIKQQLTDSQIIYPSGGNTFYLMHWIRKCGLDKYLEQLLDDGRIYIGGSASSIVVGPNVELAGWNPDWDTNDIGLRDMRGLNLVPFVVSPHFEESHRSILESHQVNYKIVPVTNQQAVYFHDREYEIVGDEEVVQI